MPYALHAEGLITTCEAISTLGIPIYITETGCADAGDTVRPQMIQSYMAAVEETVRRGVDLRGVMYWTLIDNFEWAFGFKMRFGIYHWECNNDHKRTKRKSAALLAHWFEQLKEKAPKLRAAAGLDGGAVEGRAEKVAVAVS